MVVPGLGEIFEIDLEPKLRAGFQRSLTGTECGVGAFLNGFPFVIRKNHLEVNLSYGRR